jgi:hypothetical protein
MSGVTPGDDAGDCPRCEATMTQIGHGHTVLGAHCDECNLMVALSGDAMRLGEATARDWSDYAPPSSRALGPDPMP